jgi:uncharacterized protein
VSYTLEVIPKPRLDRILKELRQALEVLYGERLSGLYLFGSYARGEAEPGSDIDVAVVLAGDVDPFHEIDVTIAPVSDLSLDNDTVVSLMFVSASDYVGRWTPFLANLRREGLAV